MARAWKTSMCRTGRLTGGRLPTGVAAAAAALLLMAASPAFSIDEAAERQVIEDTLQRTIVQGYLNEDLEVYLSLYDDEARIVSYVIGATEKKGYAAHVARDFAGLSNQEVALEVLGIDFDGDEATVTVRIMLTGDLVGGHRANRSDRYFLRMKKTTGGWKVTRQSYREDFGVSTAPHPPR